MRRSINLKNNAIFVRNYSSLNTSDKRSHYDILNLTPNSTAKEIKKQYYELAKKYHPDRNRSKSPEERRIALKQYTRVKEAYEVLGDKSKKELFDVELRNSTGSSYSGVRVRNAREANYYGHSRYSGTQGSASSLHQRTRAHTYHYYNKHHEYAKAHEKPDHNPLKSEYRSGSNYDVPHFDFDTHFKQQKSYEVHRKKQTVKRMVESEAGDHQNSSQSDYEFIFNEYDPTQDYIRKPKNKHKVSITPIGIIACACFSFIVLSHLL